MQGAINIMATLLLMASVSANRSSYNPINFGGGRNDPVNVPTLGQGFFSHRRPFGSHRARPAYGQFGSHYGRPGYGQFGSHFGRPGHRQDGVIHTGGTRRIISDSRRPSNQNSHVPQVQGGVHLGGKPIVTQEHLHSVSGKPISPSGSVIQHGVEAQSGISEGAFSVAAGISEVPHGAAPDHIAASHLQHGGGQPVDPNHDQVTGGIPSVNGHPGEFPIDLTPSLDEAVVDPNCNVFKKDPNGKYICDNIQISESAEPYECPAVTPFCPKLGERLSPPQCDSDTDCSDGGKCCPDACYNFSICRGPR